MTEHVDLKALERKAYTSYHQDGIVDIFLGLAIVTFSFVLLFLETSFYLVGGTFVVWIASYAGAKRSITVPRIGYVEFKQSRRIRVMLLVLLLLVLNIVIFAIMAFGELTTDFRIFLNQYGLLVVAGVVGGLFVLFGWVTQIYRFYGYGSVAFLAFIITHVFLLHLFFPIFVLGLTITVTGFVLLYWFIRKYPKTEPGEELYDNWDNE